MKQKVCMTHQQDPESCECSNHWQRFHDEPCKTARLMNELEDLREAADDAERFLVETLGYTGEPAAKSGQAGDFVLRGLRSALRRDTLEVPA